MNTQEKENQKFDNPLISLEKFIECECHIGLPTRFRNPKMSKFISGKERGRYIIDTKRALEECQKYYECIKDYAGYDQDIMFVGVKNKMTAPIIEAAAIRSKSFYLTQRWLGGLLTNFKTINLNIKKLNELDELLSNPSLQEGYTKKEIIQMSKKRDKLEKFYGGIKSLQKVPDLLVVFNPEEDVTAVKEAKKMGIPVIALSNINTNVDFVDGVVPGNNVTVKSVYFFANLFCDAIVQAHAKDSDSDIETVIAYKKAEEIIIPEEYSSKQRLNERGNISFL